MATKIIDNFGGRLTRDSIGDSNSGLAKYNTSFGYDPFSNITNLTWLESPTQIDSSVITDLIMCARPRIESGITYVYAVGHTGRFYKIQVNQPSSYNPNLDQPVLIKTLTALTPHFKYGSSIQFFGATELVYIMCDEGVIRIGFDGTGETALAGLPTPNVPRPSVQFLGNLYIGNGTNLAQIDSTGTLIISTKLSPGFPSGTYVRDLDVSPDGNYLQIIVSRLNSPDLTSTTQDTTNLSSTDSYKFLWNGTDLGYTSYETYSGYTINSNNIFGANSYIMGYDSGGAAVYDSNSRSNSKILSLPNSISPNFAATFSSGNMMGFATPETAFTVLQGSIMMYGQYDNEVPKGLYRFLRKSAITNATDIIQMPCCLTVSNLFYGSSSAGYVNNQVGSAKIYFSTMDTSNTPTVSWNFWKFTTVPTGVGQALIGGVYETQNETTFRLFRQIISNRFKVTNVRFYTEPLKAGVSFKIDLIGSNGNPITGGSHTFTVGSGGTTAGDDRVLYTPNIAPTYSVGVRITNLGGVNWVGTKLEFDYEEAGV